jgi:hypothetical protein
MELKLLIKTKKPLKRGFFMNKIEVFILQVIN